MSAILLKSRVKGHIDDTEKRFGVDRKGGLEWLETERAQQLYIGHNAGNKLVRIDALDRAAALETAIEEYKEGSRVAAADIEVGETGDDWEPTAATAYYAQLDNKRYEFGPTKDAARAALLAKFGLSEMHPDEVIRRNLQAAPMARVEYDSVLTAVLGRADAREYLAGRRAARTGDNVPTSSHAPRAYVAGFSDVLKHDQRFGAFLFREQMVIAGYGYILKSISRGN